MLGISFLSVPSYILGIAQIDVRYFFWGFFILGMGFAAYAIVQAGRKSSTTRMIGLTKRITSGQITVGAVLTMAVVSLVVLSTLNPGSDWDAVQLYLPMGKIVFENGFLPAHSLEIGRDIVNFFLMGYVDGYAMTISGSFLFPPSILAISWATLIGLAAAIYEIAFKILRRSVESLVAAAFVLTLPIISFYFAWTPRYVDIPSVFLAFSFVLQLLNFEAVSVKTRVGLALRNVLVGAVAFTAIGFKLQNLLILALVVTLLVGSVTSKRRRNLILAGVILGFAIAIDWGLTYGTVLSDLSYTGTTSPILVILVESSTLLLAFTILVLRGDNREITVAIRSFLPGVILGYALWFVRPTILESTPFYPASLPNTPAFVSARQTYSSVVRSLFSSSILQYGIAVPYLSLSLGPLILPLIGLGGYSLMRRKNAFTIKWVLLLNAAATLLTGYVDSRYAIWVIPLSGILVGESVAYLRARISSTSLSIASITLVLMSLGLGINGVSTPVEPNFLSWTVLLVLAGCLYAGILLWRPARRALIPKFPSLTLHNATAGALLLACVSVSTFALTYGTLIVDDSKLQGLEPKYEEVYAFLQSNVSKGSTVLAVGFPGIYYRTGLNSIPLDDPEGLARLYPYSSENNLTAAAIHLKETGVSSIIVPTSQNTFWYGYYQSLESKLPIMTIITTGPVSQQAFVGSDYIVYRLV